MTSSKNKLKCILLCILLLQWPPENVIWYIRLRNNLRGVNFFLKGCQLKTVEVWYYDLYYNIVKVITLYFRHTHIGEYHASLMILSLSFFDTIKKALFAFRKKRKAVQMMTCDQFPYPVKWLGKLCCIWFWRWYKHSRLL